MRRSRQRWQNQQPQSRKARGERPEPTQAPGPGLHLQRQGPSASGISVARILGPTHFAGALHTAIPPVVIRRSRRQANTTIRSGRLIHTWHCAGQGLPLVRRALDQPMRPASIARSRGMEAIPLQVRHQFASGNGQMQAGVAHGRWPAPDSVESGLIEPAATFAQQRTQGPRQP